MDVRPFIRADDRPIRAIQASPLRTTTLFPYWVMLFVLSKINLSLVPPWDGSFCASQGQSQPSLAIGNHSIQGVTVYTPQVQSQPALAIGNHSIQGITVYTPQVQSQRPLAIGNHSIQGVTVYTPQGQSQPPFIMGSNYVEGHGHGVYSSQSRPVSQSQPPMGRTSVHHVTYPTYDELLRGTTVQHFPVQMSQASHSPADSHVHGHR
ncbi:hypothetical protein TEA_016104 [Camellia sinensis var. sinensis]|uniref:Uncharacterized protein n=1 Tax=Camellia sinensis var. sinensis TaxID=542762 RepID=A0A4S4ETW4_CAMSN|nr:hypothetical protein TEA_016104 [Camellia sinensis var. sinensis]